MNFLIFIGIIIGLSVLATWIVWKWVKNLNFGDGDIFGIEERNSLLREIRDELKKK